MSSSKLDHQQDFTTEQYAQLLRLAKLNYKFIGYWELDLGEKFVLWRHDCDYSLNRSLRLAQIEHQESVKATYFLNPHCEFYNLLEKGQAQIVKEILALGHDIGLHFDAAYYDVQSESRLDALVEREASWIAGWFGVKPVAFSFHNPTEFLLSCDQDSYGGLPNCYSKTFKTKIPYCSDSNGYWRFRRLWDVLEGAKDPCLQALTHPGWWQDKVSPPRQRIFRSVYGRAKATMQLYDDGLDVHGRENLSGASVSLAFMRPLNPELYQFCDMLWMSGQFEALFGELWRLHESQINRLCKAVMRNQWQVPAAQINMLFEDPSLSLEGWQLFSAVFDESWWGVSGVDSTTHLEWIAVRTQLVHGRAPVEYGRLQGGCVYLCQIIASLAAWGKTSTLGYDGVADLHTIGLSTRKTENGDLTDRLEESSTHSFTPSIERWLQFTQDLKIVTAGEAGI